MALIEKGPFERFRDWLEQRLKPPPQPVATRFVHPGRDVVWRQDGPEPGVWVELVRRSDDLYSFAEWKRQMVSAPGIAPWETESAVFESGLYGAEDEARQAMIDHIQRFALIGGMHRSTATHAD